MDYTGLELQGRQIRLITLCPVPAGADPATAPIQCTMTVRNHPLPTDPEHAQSASASASTYFSFDHAVTDPPRETLVGGFRQSMAPLLAALEGTEQEHVITFPINNFAKLLRPQDRVRVMGDFQGGIDRRIIGWGSPGFTVHSFEDAAGVTLAFGDMEQPPSPHIGLLAPGDLNPFLRPQHRHHGGSLMSSVERAMQQLPPDAYVAMSYAWGPPEPTREIMVNGRIVVVRANLEAGLREFRKLDYFRLGGKIWVDSLCINQADDTEKGKQIPMMASIYCNAANIIVWLGPEESGSDLAISFLEHISASYRTEYLEALDKSDPLTATTWRTVAQVIMETNYKKFREVFYDSVVLGKPGPFADFEDMAVDLYNFFDRPYWRRLWIIQEVCMGRAGMPIVCGSRVTQWRYIRDGALICTAVLDILRELTVESIMRQCRAAMVGEHSLLHVAQIAQLEINGHRLELPKLPPDVAPILAPTMYEHGPLLGLPIRRAITLAAQSACWKQHDRIYGMLSIPGLPDLDIQVDYSRDVVDVFTEFTVACVRHGSLDFFAILDGGHMSRTDEHGNPQPRTKPSWVPDYGAKPGRKIGVIDGEWNAGGYVPISWGHLEVVDQTLVCTGKVVDMVDGVGAMSTADIETGSMILADEDPFPKMIQPSGTGAAPKDGGEAVIYDVLVAGCDIHGGEAPESFDCLYSALPVDEPPKHSTLYRNWHFLKSSADYLVNGCPLSSYFTHLAKVSSGAPAYGQEQEGTRSTAAPTSQSATSGCSRESFSDSIKTAAARQAMEARTKMRRLLTTTSGLLGLAPLQSQPGDAVIAIVGHSKPVIARKVATVEGQDIWYLIGEAYIHGMMRAQKLPLSTKPWHARETSETLEQVGLIRFI